MSYTLRGRLESRLAAALLPLLAACVAAVVLHAWWPVELAGAMVAAGLALDALVYDRYLPYQPGWAALPLGVLELAATMVLVGELGIAAPVEAALWFFVGSWLVAQILGHAGLPVLRLTYAEDGGELGRAGTALLLAAPVVLLLAVGTAAATQPPTVLLSAGVHRGPLVLDRSQKLVGEPGAIVRGGIVVTADDVTVRDVTVVGGLNGIDVQWAEDVLLEDVTVVGAKLDGIHARRSAISIHDCRVVSPPGFTQGIDISFAADLGMSMVEGCTISGGQEGIVTHSAMVDVGHNHVSGTSLRGITMTEMSMGMIERNHVADVLGVGIYCGDYSECEIEDNTIVEVRPDVGSGDPSRFGIGIVSFFGAHALLEGNEVTASREAAAFADATIMHR
jgi:nitrous oxidase accessory protein NosD